ncbi:MAG: penicillin-binding protein activator [Desulfobacter sp.]|nr:MAG: penicillin-binding protein activator [Desulfobacter sp.]
MKKHRYVWQISMLFMGMFLVASFWGCAQKPGVKPLPPLISVLMTQAQTFADQANYQDALLVYNQALAKVVEQGRASEATQKKIIEKIEEVLAQAPPRIIQEFSEIKNLTIPQPLFQYWTGYQYFHQQEYDQARQALEAFLENEIDHPHAESARDIIKAMDQEVVKKDTIGCLLPLSGKYQVYGQKALQGIQLAVQDLSAAHGIEFKVMVKDTRSDPARAALCVEQLAQENVLAIVGPLLVPEKAGSLAQQKGIPLMAMTQKTDFPLQGDYLFSNFITPEMQVEALGKYLFMNLGLKKVAILYPNERYGKRYLELFWDVVDKFNGQVVGVEAYDGNKTDFTIPLQKLTGEYYPVPEHLKTTQEKQSSVQGLRLSSRGSAVANKDRIEIDFQALFIPDALSRVNLILPQLAFHDVRGMVLVGTNLWHQQSLLTQTKGYNKNAVICDGYFKDSQNPVTHRFNREFNEIFQQDPGFLEAIAYDTAKILFTASIDPSVDSRNSLKNLLQSGKVFEGVTGQTSFDTNGSPHKNLFLITVKKGKFREINH